MLIRKLEKIFYKWPEIVTNLRGKILEQIKQNYPNSTKRELICALCWSLGEFLDKQSNNSYEDPGIAQTFEFLECLEKLLKDKIKDFLKQSSKEVESSEMKTQLEIMLKM